MYDTLLNQRSKRCLVFILVPGSGSSLNHGRAWLYSFPCLIRLVFCALLRMLVGIPRLMLLFESGIGWTLYYNGGIFDYFLPNLRFFRKITTFGDLDLPFIPMTLRILDILVHFLSLMTALSKNASRSTTMHLPKMKCWH